MVLPRAASIYFHSEIHMLYPSRATVVQASKAPIWNTWCKGRLHNKLYYTESNGKQPHQFIPSKTATLVPEFAVEDMPFGRTAALVPEFAVKDLPLGRTLWWYINIFLRFISLLKYWWAHPIKAPTSRRWIKQIIIICQWMLNFSRFRGSRNLRIPSLHWPTSSSVVAVPNSSFVESTANYYIIICWQKSNIVK